MKKLTMEEARKLALKILKQAERERKSQKPY
jgi:hypothetical protein